MTSHGVSLGWESRRGVVLAWSWGTTGAVYVRNEGPFTKSARDSAYAQLQWACSIVGAILVTINPAYRVHELVSLFLAN